MNLTEKLISCQDFPCIFGVVKEAVEKTTGKRRGGLLLGMSDLPNHIGAFYQVGSNFIVMNRKLLADVIRTGNRQLINSYIFHILLHEYVHTLGFLDERQTHLLTKAISEEALGADHPATLIAKHGIGHVLPSAGRPEYPNHGGRYLENIEIIEDFEVDDLDYLG